MKKIKMITGVLTCLMLLLSAVGCGKEQEEILEEQQTAAIADADQEAETEESSKGESESETETETEEETDESTEESSETEETSETSTTAEETSAEAATNAPENENNNPVVTPLPVEGQAPIIEVPAENNVPAQDPVTTPVPDPVPLQPAVGDEVTFRFNDVTLRVGDSAESFVNTFPRSVPDDAAPSCYGNGENINYHYDDFIIYVWNDNGSYMTYGIDITGSGAMTQLGITIGSTADAVIAAYGTGYTVDAMDYVYYYGDCNLRFTIIDGEVHYISYNKDLPEM